MVIADGRAIGEEAIVAREEKVDVGVSRSMEVVPKVELR